MSESTQDQHGVFVPNYASYNWIGPPADFGLATDTVTGGDSITENVNKWFQSGDQAYIMIASAMVRSARSMYQMWSLTNEFRS